MKFSDIFIITPDVAKLRAFYQKVFDCEAEGDEIHSFMTVAGLGLAIYKRNNAIKDMGFDLEDAGTGLLTIGFNVDDVHEAYKRIVSLGIDHVTEPVTWPWGATSFNFRDPDGNIIVMRS